MIARVASVDGRSRLVPVAIGELAGERYIARAMHGLPGITRGGRHVWYRVTGDLGFIVGVTEASGTPVSAVVETAGLPFVAIGATDGQFTLVARAGTAAVRARVPGTSLVGTAEAVVAANAETTANVSLAGDVSLGTIAPVNGAIAVSPAAQVEVSSPAPIAPGSVTTATITFTQVTAPSAAVPFRLVLSGSGRTLAIVPLARLAEGAEYAVSVTGLADAVGGAILVPATTFTTQSTTAPVYNLDQLVFTFPDEQGVVTLNGPPGTLAPGSTILVVNESTGEVTSLGVNNDGSVSDVGGQLVAHIADRLIVTITDLLGRPTTFKRSEYVAEDGTTAVGNGGGEILGPGGVEVRIPEDAVANGIAAILKIVALQVADLPPGFLPEIADATMGTVLKIESPEPPAFAKEVDLAFPKPADAPEDATYFIYRRMTGPNGQIAYEALDYADVEGEGADAKVVTASYPFSGYRQSVNGYDTGGLDTTGAIGNQFDNYAILMWAVDLVTPGRTLGGAITGRVLRVTQAPGSTTPTYVPVAGAIVSGVDAQGQPLFGQSSAASPATFAVSQADGTYSLFDRQYTGGTVTVSATVGGVTRTATAYEANPQDAKSPGLEFARNIAYANVTFPAAESTVAPSPVQVRVMTLDADGKRELTTGIVVAGEPLVLGVTAAGMTVQRMEVVSGTQSQEYGVRVDPLAGSDPLAADVIADGSVTFAQPGSYTVTATAVGAFPGAVTGHVVVRAVAPGGSNNDSLPNDPPSVITARTTPKADARGVPIGVLPQVVFTEPVRNLPGNVTLTDAAGQSVGISLSGVGPNGPVADLTPTSVVTSITIQPMAGLKYNTVYTLSLSSGIEDTDRDASDQPAPKPLAAYTTRFTTFAPEAIGRTTDTFTAGGMAVIGDRAYVAGSQNLGRKYTNLRLFDISDPTLPLEVTGDAPGGQLITPPPTSWLGLPVDVVGEAESPLTGGTLVAVATNPFTPPFHPANVRLYDVTDDQSWRWVGAVTLGREPIDGMIRRIRLRGSVLYAATAGVGKGIQVIDLGLTQELFSTATAGGEQSAGFWQMQGLLNGSDGFGQQAIAQSIYVDTGSGQNSQLWDLAVTDLTIDTVFQTGVVATGRSPLVVANPQTGELLYNGPITAAPGGEPLATWGYGIAAGMVAGTPIAVISTQGIGGVGPAHLLAVVNLTNPRQPVALGTVELPGAAANVHDVVLRGTDVFIGTTTGTLVVSVAEPSQPRLVGTIPGVSGRLAFGADGLLYGTYRGLTQVTSPEGGLRTAVLGTVAVITKVTEDPVIVDIDRRSIESQRLRYKLIPAGLTVLTSTLEVLQNDAVVQSIPAPFVDGIGEVELAAGVLHASSSRMTARLAVEVDGDHPSAPERVLSSAPFVIETAVPAEVQVAGEPLLITATNRAIAARLHDESRTTVYQPPFVARSIIGASGGVTTPATGSTQTGTYVSDLASTGVAGTSHQLELRMGATILGRSSPIAVIPGLASTGLLEVSRTGSPIEIPADGTTMLSFRLHQVRDVAGNAVSDGTSVSWRIEGDGGTLATAGEVLQGGQATVQYRASIEPADLDVVVEVEGLLIRQPIRQVELTTTLTAVGSVLEIDVDSAAGPPADGTPIVWGALEGRVTNADTLTGGHAQGLWVDGPSPAVLAPSSQIQLTSLVGRSRGAGVLSRLIVGASTNPTVSLGRNLLMGDRTTALEVRPGDDPWTIEAGTAVSVAGAPPQTPMRLVVGSLQNPAFQPVAAYGFEPVGGTEPTADADAYGGASLSWADEPLIVRETGGAWFGSSSLKFGALAGTAGIATPSLASTESGVNFAVRLDALHAGQVLVSRQGSFAVSTVDTPNGLRLQFSAFSSGVAQHVLSTRELEAGTWYQVAAHIRGGYLLFEVDDEPVQTTPIGTVDPSAAPLLFGGDFEGALDAIRLFDFTRTPIFTFENGQTSVDVLTDAQGLAQATLQSTGTMVAPAGIDFVVPFGHTVVSLIAVPSAGGPAEADLEVAAFGGPFSDDSAVFGAQGGGSLPNEAQPPLARGRVTAIVTEKAQQCLAALASGEPSGIAGWACEIVLGFTGVGGAAQGARDLFTAGRTLYQSKGSFADYSAATLQVGLAIVSIVPGARAVRAVVKARAAVEAAPAALKVVTRALDKEAAKAIAGTASDLIPNSLFDELADTADAGRRARATRVIGHFDEAAQDAFHNVVRRGGYNTAALVSVLDTFDGLVAKRLVHVLDKMATPPPGPVALSADALRGMGVFLTRYVDTVDDTAKLTGDARLKQIWGVIKANSVAGGDQAARTVADSTTLENTFKWINEAAGANINGLNRLLGQLKNEKFGLSGFKGVYNHLEVASEVGWHFIDRVDEVTGVAGRLDRPDLLLKATATGARLGGVTLRPGAEVEIKNLASNITAYPDVAQLRARVDAAIAAAGFNASPGQVAAQFEKLYFFVRGSKHIDNIGMDADFYRQVAKALDGTRYQGLEKSITFGWLGERLPY